MLSAFVNEHQNDWDEHLPYISMAYRAAEHETTGITPDRLAGNFAKIVSGHNISSVGA
jgi:hypothetical protein